MRTPIADFLMEYAGKGISRFHMPGHKGNAPFSLLHEISRMDITEVDGADALFEAEGIIGESEEVASSLYGSGFTCYSAAGSTLGIQTMVSLVSRPGGRLLAARNAHTAFVNACGLLGVEPVWFMPAYNDGLGVSGEITAAAVEQTLQTAGAVDGVYITSPDYFGCVSDVGGIAEICHRHGIPLLVDNAHGTHLRFLREDRHPLTLGADLCCDSPHKTLPALTGSGYLHAAKGTPYSKAEVKARMSLFASTSPSYLLLLSLDLCNSYLAGEARRDFALLEDTAAQLSALAYKKGFPAVGDAPDPTKLTLDGYAVGQTGAELAGYLRKNGIECEYAAQRHVVLMLSPQNTAADLARLEKALQTLPVFPSLAAEEKDFLLPERVLLPREALFAPKEMVEIGQALGRIAAQTKIKCPPGVPILVAGERIGETEQKLLKRSGISHVSVVK